LLLMMILLPSLSPELSVNLLFHQNLFSFLLYGCD
jgi:hypothetical protein